MKRLHTFRLLAGMLLVPAGAAHAQERGAAWPSRLGVSVHGGEFRPAGNSEAFRVFDEALTAGTDALTPRVAGVELQVRLWRRLRVVGGVERGSRTIASQSRVQPVSSATPAEQRTTLDFTAVRYGGVQWQAWQWQGASRSVERLRVIVGGGVGQSQYALRQWGEFVDVPRQVTFSDDLQSKGRGTFRYLSASVEAPLSRQIALHGDIRRHAGRAGMNGDFSAFDRLDLSGTRLSLGVLVTPWR